MNLDDAYTEFLTNQVAPPPAPPMPEPVAAPEPKPGEFHKDMSIGDYLGTVFRTLADIPDAAVRGAAQGLGETIYAAGLIDDKQITSYRDFWKDMDKLRDVSGVNPTVSGLAEDVGQILPAAVPAFKVLKAIPFITRPVAAILAEGIGGAVGYNPDDPNLGNVISGMIGDDKQGVFSQAMRMLATNPEDPDVINRARNFAQDAGIGSLFEGVFKAIQKSPDAGKAALQWFTDTARSAQQGTAFSGIPTRPDVPASAMPTEPAPVFYSAVANAVDGLPMDKGNAAQMRAMIAKSPEVKAEEMAWIGLDDFLKGKKSVTKQEIKDFVDANQVRIEEVTKGSANRVDVEAEMANDIQDVLEAGQVFDIDAQDALKTWQNNPRRQIRSQYEALLEEKLRDAGDLRTVEEFREAASANVEPTKFSDYTLPGGENYREVLLRLPEQPVSGARYAIKNADGPNVPSNATTREEAIAEAGGDASRVVEIRSERTVNPNFTGGHYGEPNVLAHMRLNDRTGPNGEKILFVEEIQSDWHQKGRKQGYNTPENEAKLDALKAQRKKILEQRDADAPDWFDRYEELSRERAAAYPDASQISEAKEVEFRNLSQQKAEFDAETKSLLADVDSQITSTIANIPDAPLKKTWHEMSFRRIARMAAEEGYDAIAWTPGKLQIDRYEETLRRNVDEITYEPNGDGTFNMAAYKNGEAVYADGEMSLEKVEEVFGKDIAEKVKEGIGVNWKDDPTLISIEGDDLSIGGEGMKGFYDKMLKDYASKWGKKFGAKVGVTDINTGRRVDANLEVVDTPSGNFVVIDRVNGGQLADFGNRQDAEAYVVGRKVEATGKTMEQVWTLPVTKKMRDSVLGKGVATFGAAGVAAGLNNQEARPDGN